LESRDIRPSTHPAFVFGKDVLLDDFPFVTGAIGLLKMAYEMGRRFRPEKAARSISKTERVGAFRGLTGHSGLRLGRT
jgi:hypothetical protein